MITLDSTLAVIPPKFRALAKSHLIVYFLIIWSVAFTGFALFLSLRFSEQSDSNTLIKVALNFQNVLHKDVIDQETQLTTIASLLENENFDKFEQYSKNAFISNPNIVMLELRDDSGKLITSASQSPTTSNPMLEGRKELPPSVVMNFFRAVEQQKPFWALSYGTNGKPVLEQIAPGGVKRHVLVTQINPEKWIGNKAKATLPSSVEVNIHEKAGKDLAPEDGVAMHVGLTGLDVQLIFRNLVTLPVGVNLSTMFILFLGIALVALLIRYNMEIQRSKRSQEQLNVQEKALAKQAQLSTLGEISTTLAHELNQPLATITNYIAMCEIRLRQLGYDDPSLHQSLTEARSQALRAGEVVQSIRNFLRKGHSAKATVDVAQSISHLMPILNALVHERDATLEVVQKEDLHIRIDPALFEQMLLNLCKNGLDAMTDTAPESRKLVIFSKRQRKPDGKSWVHVSVQDSGHGIRSEDGDKLFDSFFTTKIEGLGIGLNLVKSLTQSHGGQISWANNAERGVTFTLEFPEHNMAE
jgi:signal transduction histidine kinase